MSSMFVINKNFNAYAFTGIIIKYQDVYNL